MRPISSSRMSASCLTDIDVGSSSSGGTPGSPSEADGGSHETHHSGAAQPAATAAGGSSSGGSDDADGAAAYQSPPLQQLPPHTRFDPTLPPEAQVLHRRNSPRNLDPNVPSMSVRALGVSSLLPYMPSIASFSLLLCVGWQAWKTAGGHILVKPLINGVDVGFMILDTGAVHLLGAIYRFGFKHSSLLSIGPATRDRAILAGSCAAPHLCRNLPGWLGMQSLGRVCPRNSGGHSDEKLILVSPANRGQRPGH